MKVCGRDRFFGLGAIGRSQATIIWRKGSINGVPAGTSTFIVRPPGRATDGDRGAPEGRRRGGGANGSHN